MSLFSSLTNRIFFGSALLAVVSIGIAIYNVNVAVTAQAEEELRRGLNEAGTLIEEYRRVLFEHFTREARLIADLPRLKATVELNDPATMESVAEAYRELLDADLFLVTGRNGRVLVAISGSGVASDESLPGIRSAAVGQEATSFWPHPGGILQVVSVPIWINPEEPEILGTLNVGFSLNDRAAARFRALTDSEIAFGVNGAIRASTLPPAVWPTLAPLLAREGLSASVTIDGSEYIVMTRALSSAQAAASPAVPAVQTGQPVAMAVILQSRTERLRFLNTLHTSLLFTAFVAVLAATLLSYGIARTVTRPLGAITATMRETAVTGDLTRRIALPAGARWEDEDARLVATTFNTMTESIARFQREAAQRERLSALGRLSTVVAHEIRNPLMIIKTALRALRSDDVSPAQVRTAVVDIDEEVARLNRIVTEVLDFARPIHFDLVTVDVNALCEDAARASTADPTDVRITLRLHRSLPEIVTDPERLRLTLVNILTNARHSVAGRNAPPLQSDPIVLETSRRADGRVQIEVRDRGAGIAPEDLPRVFDPYFTTRRTGTGLGLAISRNIVEGLGGTITVHSRPGEGTQVRIELPPGNGRAL